MSWVNYGWHNQSFGFLIIVPNKLQRIQKTESYKWVDLAIKIMYVFI